MTVHDEGHASLAQPGVAPAIGSSDTRSLAQATDIGHDNTITLHVEPQASVDVALRQLQDAGLISRSAFGWWDLHLPSAADGMGASEDGGYRWA